MTDLAEAVIAALADAGTDTVFGIPGTHNLPLVAAMGSHGIRLVGTRHEQGAVYAADAYARVSGRPGVVLATTGPGAVNAATGMAQAWSDSSPVLLLAPGMPTTADPGTCGRLHEMPDQFAALAGCVDRAVTVVDGVGAREAVAGFWTQAHGGRPRPWYLHLPLDRLTEPVPPSPTHAEPARARGSAGAVVPADAVSRAARLLTEARRPVLIVGGGAREAAAEVRSIAESLGAPVLATAAGRTVLAEDHPLSLGCCLHLAPAVAAVADADAVLVVGCELAETDAWGGRLPLPEAVVRVDVDPAGVSANAAEPTVALVGRARDVLPGLAAAIARGPGRGAAGDGGVPAARPLVRAAGMRRAAPWAGLLAGVQAALPTDAVITADTAQVAYDGAHAGLRLAATHRYLFPTGFGTLGWAVPAAVGATLAAAGRPVIALSGDGGLAFSLAELATLADLGAPVPVLVADNGGYGEIRDRMADRGQQPVAVDVRSPDWAALARSLGLAGVRVSARSDDPACAGPVAAEIAAALTRDRPTLIAVATP